MLFPIVGQTLVERHVFISGDIFWFSHPDWLGLVEDFEFIGDFLNLLLFLLLWLVVILDFWIVLVLLLIVFLLIILLLVIIIRVGDFLVGGLLNHELNWETNEF